MKYSFAHKYSTVEYDSETGVFTWVCAFRKPWRTGQVATRAYTNGYLYMVIGGKRFSASRLAWTLAKGPIPEGHEMDHANRVRSDNRIENLRTMTHADNLARRLFAPNSLGVTGVSVHRKTGLYRARYKGKVTYHRAIEDAAKSYKAMKAK